LNPTRPKKHEHSVDVGENIFIVMDSGEAAWVFRDRQRAREITDDDPEARYMIETEITGFYP
jgi:hypothetical protein